jgi:hypothetical protein
MGTGWKFAELTRRRVKRLVSDGLALVYPRKGTIRAAALLDVGQIDNDMCLGFVDGTDAEIALLARDARRVASESGRAEVSAMLPEGRIAEIVRRSGFNRETPMQAVVYELGARGFETLPGLRRGRDRSEPFADVLDRIYRANEGEAIDRVADLLIEKAPRKLNRQNVRDYVMRDVLPDTTRQLMASMLALSNRLRQNEIRLVLRALVMHMHTEYGLSGSAMSVGHRSVSVSIAGKRAVHIACARSKLTMTLGPGFGACFPPDLDLDAGELVLDKATRDRSSGRYERAKLTLTKRSHAQAAIKAIDIIMRSALPRRK